MFRPCWRFLEAWSGRQLSFGGWDNIPPQQQSFADEMSHILAGCPTCHCGTALTVEYCAGCEQTTTERTLSSSTTYPFSSPALRATVEVNWYVSNQS